MLKFFVSFIKKITFSIGVIYSFNIIMQEVGMFIPLNLTSITVIFMLGFPGLLSIIGILFII